MKVLNSIIEKELAHLFGEAKEMLDERLNSLVRIQHSVVEEEKNYVVKLTLAGMLKEDVVVELNNNVLTVKSNPERKNKQNSFFKEFSKQIDLSSYSFDKAAITSEINNGILAIFLPKVKVDKQTIEVNVVEEPIKPDNKEASNAAPKAEEKEIEVLEDMAKKLFEKASPKAQGLFNKIFGVKKS